MSPFVIAVVIYLACGGLLWLVAYFLAPVGYEISLWRGIGAVFLITVFLSLSEAFLRPVIGDWHMLVDPAAQVFIVRSMLRLSVGRSLAAVIIYWVVLTAAVYFLVIRPGRQPRVAASWSATTFRPTT